MVLNFRKNIGTLDQLLRLGIGGAMFYFGFLDSDLITDTFTAHIVGVLGLVNAIVAMVRFCPLYAAASISTCRNK